MDREGVVIVVGSARQQYRQYLLDSASRRQDLWLLDGAPPTWQRPYVRETSVVPLVDRERLIPNQELMVKTAQEIAADVPVRGVFTYDETLVVTTAHIAEALGLPGLSVDGVENCRNKHRNRRALTAAGLPQPRFAYVTTLADAVVVAAEFGYPVVVKPRGCGASIGVVRAADASEIAAAFAVAEGASHTGAPAYEGGVLVEEYLEGPEISVDGALHRGEYQPFFLARKRIGAPPYFDEIGHTVSVDDPLLDDPEIMRVLTEAHRAVGVRDGITHTELRLTDRGPAIIEINARLGGDLIPYIGRLATGIDPAFVAVDLATGVGPDLTRTHRTGTVGIRFLNPPVDGRITGMRLPEPGAVPGLEEASPMVEPGTLVMLPPRDFLGRFAYLICRAESPEACDAALDAAAALVEVDVDPIDVTGDAR
ncbi:ATP-grasp domain-containing protein [Dactylosporangium sp. NPDC005572]|uniref:ATP-grasp domain-containing protein n=1 Tax=Dactylosporangium sp. NPDC005572 TaxID=3156889 RepID=UPI0033BC32AB